MEEKEIKIQVPEGYEIDKENSTFECIKFKKKDLTLTEIFNKSVNQTYAIKLACSTAAHTRKINAINTLMIVAKYLNDEWTPNFMDTTRKYYFYIKDDEIQIDSDSTCINSVVYFNSRELANQTIKILGEETIKKALSVDY